MMLPRRAFLAGLVSALAAPAIVRAELIMPVRKIIMPVRKIIAPITPPPEWNAIHLAVNGSVWIRDSAGQWTRCTTRDPEWLWVDCEPPRPGEWYGLDVIDVPLLEPR